MERCLKAERKRIFTSQTMTMIGSEMNDIWNDSHELNELKSMNEK